jgi:hypothetical protein
VGWRISRKDGKFRVWSTISNDWLTDWISRKEFIKFYHDDMLIDFKKKIVEQYYKFPHGWFDQDRLATAFISDEDGYGDHLRWMDKLNKTKDYDEYVKLVEEMYDQIMKELEEE